MSEPTYTYCPYCDRRIEPGQEVVGIEDAPPSDEEPWGVQSLWHKSCREMWQYDEKLAEQMSKTAPLSAAKEER